MLFLFLLTQVNGQTAVAKPADTLALTWSEPVGLSLFLPLISRRAIPDQIMIAAGYFQMGCDVTIPGEACYDNEFPLHKIYLDAYTIDTLEVTNAHFASFLNAVGNQEEGGVPWFDDENIQAHLYQEEGVWKPETGYEQHPVILVSWYGARAYCEWRGMRLPSEAEWEKAARGHQDTRSYPWGNQKPDCSLANFNAENPGYCIGGTSPVGHHLAGASPYGALDMSGNVYEWVNDWYSFDYYSQSPVKNPPGPISGDERVFRGGSWFNPWVYQRLSSRPAEAPYGRFGNVGFRCAGSIP